MQKVDGRLIASKIIEKLKGRPVPNKILAAVLVGNDKASQSFLKVKEGVASDLGIRFDIYQLSDLVTQDDLEEKVKKISNDSNVGGIIVQLPLPKKFDREKVLNYINPKKDVDALTAGALVESPVIGVIKEILDYMSISSLKDLKIVVVGRGRLVGQPVIKWLERENSCLPVGMVKFKVADSKTKNLAQFLSNADLIITGVGNPPAGGGLINPEWLKEGAGIIDFGFPPDLDILKIDPPAGGLNSKLGFYTPTPGGTGPILVAKLFENFYKLND